MSIATFSFKTFSVSSDRLYTFNDFTRSGSLNFEEQESEGQKPSTCLKGCGLEEINFNVPLVLQNGIDIEAEIESWFEIMESATPYVLIIGGKPIGRYKYILVSVSVSDSYHDKNGKYLKATIQLKFKEFVRQGFRKDDSESRKAKKRTNTNATISKADGYKMDSLETELWGE